jgi:RNA polymerase sigma-70 factor (ECF subfamily)
MTDASFAELVEPYRRELHVHCYRLLGSLTDAEDVLQEALLAAWRGLAGFEGRASLRTWLYRIATNRCLNAIRDRKAPTDPVPPFEPPEPTHRSDVTWLQPYPDALLAELPDRSADPEARYGQREAVELAFVAGLQRLPPRQAATLVLRDVLGYSATEVAEMLDTTETAVKGALQRARAALAHSRPARDLVEAGSARSRRCPSGSPRRSSPATSTPCWGCSPTTRGWPCRPAPNEYHGQAAIAGFLRVSGAWRGERPLHLIPTRANGQPAFGCYIAGAAAGIMVLTVHSGGIGGLTRFLDTRVFAAFDLPPRPEIVVPPDYGERMTLDLLSLLPAGWRERIEPHLDPPRRRR